MDESLATVLEVVADARPDRLAVSHGDRRRTWAELDERADRLAGHLAGAGIGAGDRVAIGLWNGIEYLETVLAVLKLRAVPLNVNYRYRREELVALLGAAGARGLVLDAALAERVDAARPDLPQLQVLVQVGGDADGYAAAVTADRHPRQERGDDEWLMYTGGTTGRPKGVLARHSWLFDTCCRNGLVLLGRGIPADLAGLRAELARVEGTDPMVCLPAPPLMHSTGMYTTLGALLAGGRVVYLVGHSYDPAELAATIGREQVDTVSVVGDVFARPLVAELDLAAAAGRPYPLDSLRRVLSVGVAWSADVKERLLAHADVVCRDLVAASEGGPFAVAETRRGEVASTTRFRLLPGARVLTAEGQDVVPGSGEVGRLAAPADPHIRYVDDAAATAATFPTWGGVRWVVPGDLAEVEPDGGVLFHGRGSRVINTGGEKVFAEEVEQLLLTHPDVLDALVVGAPDPRWGARVAAVVQLRPGADLDTAAAADFVGATLADHKRPRSLVVVPEVRRSPSGKADLRWARELVGDRAPDQHLG